jgi:hypothetical protein
MREQQGSSLGEAGCAGVILSALNLGEMKGELMVVNLFQGGKIGLLDLMVGLRR